MTCRCHNYSCGRCIPDPTCAICTSPIKGMPHMEPIGRNDALVPVCSECATESPIAKFGPEMSYQPGDRTPTVADADAARAPAACWVAGMELEYEPGKPWVGGERAPASKRTERRKASRARAAERNAAALATKIGGGR